MADTSLSIVATTDPPGIEISDPIEGRHVGFHTPETPALDPVSTEGFLFPVDVAREVWTTALRMDRMDYVSVWAADGTANQVVPATESRSFDAGEYQIEISAPVKLYLEVTGPLTVSAALDHVDITFEEETRVRLGARSYHQRPAGTVTIGDDPADAMVAISTFASSLKTTTPDVSFPTLRGHPPLIEAGDELHVPEGLSPPDSGITIEVPATRRMIYPTASLAFYLGASVEEGPTPRITTADGLAYGLDDERWLEDAVAKTLRKVFLFDGVVRAEGLHGQSIFERDVVEPLLDRDLATLYDLPMRERLVDYLDVPAEAVADVGPRWAMTAYVPPTRDGAKLLPHVVDDLGIVRNPRGTRIDDQEARTRIGVPDERSRQYLSTGGEQRVLVRPSFFDDSVEHVWFGAHVPVGATKGTLEAFENALERPAVSPPLDVAIVLNRGPDESASTVTPAEAYHVREEVEYSLETIVEADRARLESVFTAGYDVVHFVGETVPDGFVAADGVLSVADLEAVDLGVFFVEAPHSFEEGLWLARNGALGGIASVGSVDVAVARALGDTVVRLLNMGFPLRGALDIARRDVEARDQFVIVGNGSADIAQSESGLPAIVEIGEAADDSFQVSLETFPGGMFGVGSTVDPNFSSAKAYLGPGGNPRPIRASREEVEHLATNSSQPVYVAGQFHWDSAAVLTALGRS